MDEEQGTTTTTTTRSSNADRQSLTLTVGDEVVINTQQRHLCDVDEEDNASSNETDDHRDHDNDDNDNDDDDDDDCVEEEEEEENNDETEGFITSSSSSSSSLSNNSIDMKKMKKKPNNNMKAKVQQQLSNSSSSTQSSSLLLITNFFSFLNTNDDDHNNSNSILYKTLLPDNKGIYFRGYPMLDNGTHNNGFTVKLLKFILITYLMIGIIHIIVSQLFNDRDRSLKLWHILVFESDLIVRDCVIFFIIGRLYKKSCTGIDNIFWMVTSIMANIYFESQNFIWFLQHSVSLYEIHCIWPWELWLFVILLIPTIVIIIGLHILKGYRENTLLIKLSEMILCILFFIAPMITSNYFHLHHWYAGWLLGMHCNYNTWWSKMTMAWCWGMYINGIAVYGRDPVLTCEYAFFLTLDNRCPYISCYLDALQDENQTDIIEMVPVDWMNCSAASSSNDYMP